MATLYDAKLMRTIKLSADVERIKLTEGGYECIRQQEVQNIDTVIIDIDNE